MGYVQEIYATLDLSEGANLDFNMFDRALQMWREHWLANDKERLELAALFAKIDKNNDGSLEPDELTSFLRDLNPGITDASALLIFNEMVVFR